MIVEGKHVRIVVSSNLVAFNCIWILYGGLDAWPINTEIHRIMLLFVEYRMSQSMAFQCISKLILNTQLWTWGAETHTCT